MKPASKVMEDKINKTKLNKPFLNILNNVTACPENNPENIKRLLVEQIYSTVKWRESIIKMYELGVKNFIEVGPGKVLSGMVKRTVNDVKTFSINSIADMKNFSDEFKK